MKSLSWKRKTLKLPDGSTVEAIQPLVISASRATDIPALYSEWLIDRFKQNFTVWTNPFNGKQQFIALDAVEIIAFWSKNPLPLLSRLHYFDSKNIGYFFHFTLNDYEAEDFEPGIPSLDERITQLKTLSQTIGKEKVLWRFDPIIITPTLSPVAILEKIERIGNEIAHYVNRLTISFLSRYPRAIRTMNSRGIFPHERTNESISIIGEGLDRLSRHWNLPVVTCAEETYMRDFGIMSGSCIDPLYIMMQFPEHSLVKNILSHYRENTLFGSEDSFYHSLKDPGQRPRCRCMISKDIGRYNTCTLGCLYCYAGGRQNHLRLSRP